MPTEMVLNRMVALAVIPASGIVKSSTMPTDYHYHLHIASEEERSYLESLIREEYERCHPGETLEDLKRRASFSKEDRGLLRDWMAVAAARAATGQAKARDD